MAKIIAGMGTSHVPPIGLYAVDQGKEHEPYWKPLFDGLEPVRSWHKTTVPDVTIIVYNDHATVYALDNYATFTVGVAETFNPADEGYGPRPVPVIQGHPQLAWHLVESLILDEFDLAVSGDLDVDHGLTVPLSVAYGKKTPADSWPTRVIPVCVNVIQHPQPTSRRCYKLGQAIGKAVASYPEDITVGIWGTGGLSHQLGGERAGLINKEFDTRFLDNLVDNPEENAKLTHTDFIREAGSEGIEMIMWNVMRGALGETVKEAYRFYHVPISNTAYAALILENETR